MRKINIKNKGITLVALVITIIILLILSGITIGVLGQSGLFEKTKKAKILAQIATSKEEVNLAISELIIENKGETKDITPKMIAEAVNNNNKRNVTAENESTFPTNIVYPEDSMGIGEKIFVKVGQNLKILESKTENGTSDRDDTSENNKGETSNVAVGKVSVTVTDVKAKKFTINVNPEKENNIALYQYYLNGNLIHEGTEKQYIVTGLDFNTNYNIEVRVVPRATVSVAKLQQKTLDEPVIELADKFDRYIYIDSSNGSDTTGDGSKNKPYATLNKIAQSGIIENNYSYGVVLNDGNYELTEKVFELKCNKSINLIGDKEKTILKVNGIYPNKWGGKIDYSVNFYRLIWDGNNYNNNNIIDTKTNINLYNVSIINIVTDGWTSYFYPDNQGKTQYTLNNCVFGQYVKAVLRTTHGSIQLTNCYGGFTSGYSTSDSSWDYKTNYITTTPKVDSKTYQITDDNNIWKNVGTGINPDGSQASLGVYGGEYSWEYNDDIF